MVVEDVQIRAEEIESTRVAKDERVPGRLYFGAISNAGVQSSSAFGHSKERISSRSS